MDMNDSERPFVVLVRGERTQQCSAQSLVARLPVLES